MAGAALLATVTTALMLICIWGGQRYAWASPEIIGLLGTLAISAIVLVARTRRAEDPIVPLTLLRSPVVALSSAALFLVTATMFSITVFVPLFLQTTTGASPTQAGLLLIPMLVGITLSTNLAGRVIERTGRYKRFPLTGLAMISVALVALAVVAEHPSRVSTGLALALFGLGFGMVGQVLIIAVQNGVDRRQLGVAMAVTSFFRALGGAIGAAILGAIFAARRRNRRHRNDRRGASRAGLRDRWRAHRVPRDRAARTARGDRDQGSAAAGNGPAATGRTPEGAIAQSASRGRNGTITQAERRPTVALS